jgi:hypothetical protein
MVLLENNKRRCQVSAIPQRRKVAVSAGKLIEDNSCGTCQMALYVTLPERETLFQYSGVVRRRPYEAWSSDDSALRSRKRF